MRVALASLLFSQPDVLLLDEPSNHLDLEAVLWLEDFLKTYPATILLVSHERDFLNNVVDHILHLGNGKLTLYPGGYDAFERQRAERQAQLASARARQQAEREKLQAYIAKNSAPRLDRQAGPVARQDADEDAACRRAARRSEPVLRISRSRRAAPAAHHARYGVRGL